MDIALTPDGSEEIAKRSRGTPRIAVRLLRRVRDYAHAAKRDSVDHKLADSSLTKLDVDALGLDGADRRYMRFIAEHYNGGPVGVETLAAGLAEQRDAIEETIEPFLIQLGFIQRTPRGRMLSAGGFKHLGMKAPPGPAQPDLLDDSD